MSVVQDASFRHITNIFYGPRVATLPSRNIAIFFIRPIWRVDLSITQIRRWHEVMHHKAFITTSRLQSIYWRPGQTHKRNQHHRRDNTVINSTDVIAPLVNTKPLRWSTGWISFPSINEIPNQLPKLQRICLTMSIKITSDGVLSV